MEKKQHIKTDIELLSTGNMKEFEIIFKRYHLRLLRYSIYMLKDKQEAEDLVQDVFIKIWNNRNCLLEEKNFSAFIFTILRNHCLNILKKRTIEQNYVAREIKYANEELYHISFEVEKDFIPMEEELHLELNNVINEMPVRCATAFKLKWQDGKKIREIADIMNISTTMVDKHLVKGLEIARQKLRLILFMLLLMTLEIF